MRLETFARACMAATNIRHTIGKRQIRNCPVVNVRRVNQISEYLRVRLGRSKTPLTPAHHLAALLILTSGFNSTEPKDSIYGLLGLLPQDALAGLPPQLAPDYKKRDSAVLQAYAAYLIEGAGFVDMMYQSKRRYPTATWIPDWSGMDIVARSSHDIAKYFLMAALGSPQVHTVHSRARLRVEGIRNGTVVAVGPLMESLPREAERHHRDHEMLLRRYHHVRDYLIATRAAFLVAPPTSAQQQQRDEETAQGEEDRASPPSSSPSSWWWQAKRRSWISNIRRSYNGIDEHAFEEVFVAIMNEDGPDAAFLEGTSHMVSHMVSRLKTRTSFVDDTGTVNITARPSRTDNPGPGDQLFLLRGSCHQYVLVPDTDEEEEEEGWEESRSGGGATSWKLVNATYLTPGAIGEFWGSSRLDVDDVKQFWEENNYRVETVLIG